jgi:hypothetical protein
MCGPFLFLHQQFHCGTNYTILHSVPFLITPLPYHFYFYFYSDEWYMKLFNFIFRYFRFLLF